MTEEQPSAPAHEEPGPFPPPGHDRDRDALLRMIDLKFEVCDLIRRFQDLSPTTIYHVLISCGSDYIATAALPEREEPAPGDPLVAETVATIEPKGKAP